MTNIQTQTNLKIVSVESFSTRSSLVASRMFTGRKSNLKMNHTTSSYSRTNGFLTNLKFCSSLGLQQLVNKPEFFLFIIVRHDYFLVYI